MQLEKLVMDSSQTQEKALTIPLDQLASAINSIIVHLEYLRNQSNEYL